MRKVLSFVLVLSLVLGSFGFAFAADVEAATVPSDVKGTEYETAVNVLANLKVSEGYPDGTFRPEGAVTRAEMAAFIVRELGLTSSADYMSASSFTDMKGHWGDKYVAVIAGKGIVNGYPDGSFKPDAKVSFPEAITMIVRSLGYIDGCESLVGNWPVNYVSLASDLDVTDDVKVALSGSADRGAVAIMLYNALSVANVSVNNDGEVKTKWVDEANDISTTFLTKLDCYLDKETDKKGVKILPEWQGDEDYTLIDLTEYMYAKCYIYRLDDGDDDPIIAIDEVKSDSETGEYDAKDKEIVNDKDDDFTLSDLKDGTLVYLNGAETTFGEVASVGAIGADELLDGLNITVYGNLNDSDDFDEIYGIVATAPTKEFQADDDTLDEIEDAIKDGSGDIDNIELPTVDDKGDKLDMENIVVKGAVDSLEDIKEDDIVTVYASANDVNKKNEYDKVTFEVARETKDIKVKKMTDKKVYDSDNNEYKFASIELNDGVSQKGVDISKFELTDSYTIYLDAAGYIYEMEETDAADNVYGVVVAKYPGTSGDDASIRLLTNTGDVVKFDVTDDVDNYIEKVAGEYVWSSTAAGIVIGEVVEYDTNAAGDIDELELMTLKGDKTSNVSFSEKSGKLASKDVDSGAVFFDLSDDETDDSTWDIVDSLNGDEDYKIEYVYDSSDKEIKAVIIYEMTGSDDIYMAVTSVYKTDKGGDKVQEVEGFIDGDAVTKYTNGKNVVADGSSKLYVIKYSGSDIKTATVMSGDYTKYYEVLSSDSDDVEVRTTAAMTAPADKPSYDLADDVKVYVEVYDKDGDLDDIKVGDTGDIDRGDYIYFIYDASDDEIDVVVVVEKADQKDWNIVPKS